MSVQYIRGCSVHWGYHEYIGGYHEYIRGCSVHQRDTMCASGGYHEYIPSTSGDVQYIRDTMSSLGDIMSTLGDIMSASEDVQYIGVFNRN